MRDKEIIWGKQATERDSAIDIGLGDSAQGADPSTSEFPGSDKNEK